jgi:hypothetical protein
MPNQHTKNPLTAEQKLAKLWDKRIREAIRKMDAHDRKCYASRRRAWGIDYYAYEDTQNKRNKDTGIKWPRFILKHCAS